MAKEKGSVTLPPSSCAILCKSFLTFVHPFLICDVKIAVIHLTHVLLS